MKRYTFLIVGIILSALSIISIFITPTIDSNSVLKLIFLVAGGCLVLVGISKIVNAN